MYSLGQPMERKHKKTSDSSDLPTIVTFGRHDILDMWRSVRTTHGWGPNCKWNFLPEMLESLTAQSLGSGAASCKLNPKQRSKLCWRKRGKNLSRQTWWLVTSLTWPDLQVVRIGDTPSHLGLPWLFWSLVDGFEQQNSLFPFCLNRFFPDGSNWFK